MNKKERLHSIDFLKGISILFVIFTHYHWVDQERIKLLFPFWIDMAVPIFMIISGYVSAKSLLKRSVDHLEDCYSIAGIITKLIRFIVPFLIPFMLSQVVSVLFSSDYGVRDIILAFFNGGAGPGSYYVPLMIQFIFVFPVIYYLIHKFEFKGLILCGFINFFYEIVKISFGIEDATYRLLIFRYILLIAFGCYMASSTRKKHMVASIVSFVIGAVYIVAVSFMGFVPPVTYLWTGTSMWAALYLLPIMALLLECKYLKNPVIELLGKASYNIFLVQMVFFLGAGIIYDRLNSRILELIISMVVCTVAGVVYYYIETPITSFINKKILELLKKTKA